MALDPVTAGIGLASTVLQAALPSINQEQKLSLLDAYKNRISDIQRVSDALVANPEDRDAQLAYGADSNALLDACGYPASGVASIDVAIPLDDLNQYKAVAAAYALLVEQLNAGSAVSAGQPVKP